MTLALPLASDATVSVGTSGCAGLLDWMANAPVTTSKRTWRLGMPAPPGPVTWTVAVAVVPEQTTLVEVLLLALILTRPPLGVLGTHDVSAGVMVKPPMRGAGLTVIDAVAVWPAESWTVMVTAVGAATSFASSTTVVPLTACPTGSMAALLEKAW